MSESCTVVIGAPEHLDALRKRAGADGEILGFADREVAKALEAITTRRPAAVVLERLFAATSRGAALINRIKADPDLTFAEIRIVAHDGSYSASRRDAARPRQRPPPPLARWRRPLRRPRSTTGELDARRGIASPWAPPPSSMAQKRRLWICRSLGPSCSSARRCGRSSGFAWC